MKKFIKDRISGGAVENDIFVAHCLELDLVATATSDDDAEKNIIDIILTHVTYAFETNNLENMYSPAPPEIWRRYFEQKAEAKSNRNRIIPTKKKKNKNIFIPPAVITNISEDFCFA